MHRGKFIFAAALMLVAARSWAQGGTTAGTTTGTTTAVTTAGTTTASTTAGTTTASTTAGTTTGTTASSSVTVVDTDFTLQDPTKAPFDWTVNGNGSLQVNPAETPPITLALT